MAGPNTLEFTDANFAEQVLKSDKPVLVDFWAEWCAPCRALSPVIDELASEYVGRAKVGKVDTDAAQDVSMQYGVSSIPTVLVFNRGEVVERFIGLRGKKDFQTTLNKLVGS